MTLWICILAIVISVAVGWRLNLNTGVIAMVFAFFIGYFFLGMSVDQVIAFWPVNIVFYLIAIALFFNYATINGTMEILGKKMLAALGGRRFLVPWSIALVCAVVGGLGAGASTPVIVGPFAFTMARPQSPQRRKPAKGLGSDWKHGVRARARNRDCTRSHWSWQMMASWVPGITVQSEGASCLAFPCMVGRQLFPCAMRPAYI